MKEYTDKIEAAKRMYGSTNGWNNDAFKLLCDVIKEMADEIEQLKSRTHYHYSGDE